MTTQKMIADPFKIEMSLGAMFGEHPIPWRCKECKTCFAVYDRNGEAVLFTRIGTIAAAKVLAEWIVAEANQVLQ